MVSKVVSARLDEYVVDALDKRADTEGLSRNELIARILNDYLGTDKSIDSAVDKRIHEVVDSAVDKRIQETVDSIVDARIQAAIARMEAIDPVKKPLALAA